MWETIKELGQNKTVLLFLAGIIAIVCYAIKKGYFKFNGNGVQIGLSEQQTRDLIQAQWEYCHAKCDGMIAQLPMNSEKLDLYRAKYIIARVEDVIQKSIIFNNISDHESYIKGKQELVYQTVMKRIDKDYFKTDDFKAFTYKFVEDMYKDLYRMKKLFRQGQ